MLSYETSDLLCSLCKTRNKTTEAAKFCVDCRDYYCSTCVEFHDDVPALSRHKILDSSQFQPGAGQVLQMVPTERCDKHSHKHVDMYCLNHDDVGCSACMAVDHRLYQDIFYIPDFIQNNADTSDPQAIYQELDSTTDVLEDQHKEVQLEKERLQKSKDQSLKKMKEFRVEINQHLDQLEQKSTADIEGKYKPKLDKLDEQMDAIQKKKVKVSSAKDDLSTAGENVSQVFVSTKKGKIAADDALKYVDEIKRDIKGKNEEFIPERTLTSLLKELNLLGQLTETDTGCYQPKQKASVVTSGENSSKKQTGKASQNDCKTLIKVIEKKNYNIRIPSDKEECNIYSVCDLDDGTIILADYGNKKLKRVDSLTYTVTNYCNVSGQLYQVCKISNQEVAVSCGLYKYIQFVSLGSKMVPTKQIKTDHRCYGLAYAAGHLCISDDTSVYIYTVSGSKLQRFNPFQSGQRLFSDTYSLAVSNDGSKIYVADLDFGLISFDRNGKVLGKFNGPELGQASDVCTTNNGSVLGCGYRSKNVLQFTPDCKKIGEVLKCDAACSSVCYDPKQSKIIVGCCNNNIDVYKVVELEINI
ncbi:uncharacterized protein LOC123529035 [Mercenaria mercenaria]|uniref:uncharacterized protein LOC123529035 n=1 Tax=Mercenaria mercenaria TaxID=6596 RepID=UPI00234F4F75|nr:uncharacterized protein LOC123529035 [Mercenaria mercenaria]